MSTINIPASIFKAYDIRGIVGEGLTTDTVRAIGQAIGSEALARGQQTVATARDGRLSGPELQNALNEGLCAAGCDVLDIGAAPTPVLYFTAAQKTNGTGVMVTGSHNPPEYNGMKMMIAGTTFSGDAIQALHKRIIEGDFAKGMGTVTHIEMINAYIERICSDVKLKRPMKVVIDCGNGIPGAVAPQLAQALGCEVTPLFCEVDGNFPNHHPDPSKPENLEDLKAELKKGDYDIGLAFDGDGDRLGVVTKEGDVIWPDRQMMLYSRDILARNPGATIIYDIKCTSNLAKEIEKAGGTALMWRTGHSFIKTKLKESDALLAGEMSGHIFFKERWYGFDDATYTAARLLEILSADARPVSEIFAELPDMINTPELNVHMGEEGAQHSYMDKLSSSAKFDGAAITTIDGIRADFADGWGLVRASNTTPVLVLRFEAKDEVAINRIKEAFRTQMLAINPELELPF